MKAANIVQTEPGAPADQAEESLFKSDIICLLLKQYQGCHSCHWCNRQERGAGGTGLGLGVPGGGCTYVLY